MLLGQSVGALGGPVLTTRPLGSTPADVGAVPVDQAISSPPAQTFPVSTKSGTSCTFADVKIPGTTVSVKHVAPCQTGGGNGSAASPWRTIREAMTNLNPGEVAYVHDDKSLATDYAENNLTQGKDGLGANARIRLMGAPGEAKPVITEPDGAAANTSIFRLTRSWWIIEGLHIRGTGVDFAAPVIRISRPGTQPNYLVLRNILGTQDHVTKAFISFENTQQAAVLNSEFGEALDNHNRPARVPTDNNDHHAIQVVAGSSKILIRNNSSYGHNGDSVQCGEEDTTTNPITTDLTIENNRFHHDEENAVDLKACQGVTVRGNKMYGYRPARPFGSSRAPQGDAVVVHGANSGRGSARVLVERNRLWDNSRAISVSPNAISTVIRRNLIFNANADTSMCSMAAGMSLAGQRVEAYHNTLDNLPAPATLPKDCYHYQDLGTQNQALRLGSDSVSNVALWNNIVSHATKPYAAAAGPLTLDANRNLFQQSFSNMPPNSLVGDPLYIDQPAVNDYYTRQGSPARDKAQAVAATVSDPATYCDDPTPGEGDLIAQPDIGFVESCQ